jgi:hypothetical protein
MGHKFGFSWSWKRASGLSSAKSRLSRRIGIPLSRSSRQRSVDRGLDCWAPLAGMIAISAAILIAVFVGIAGCRREPATPATPEVYILTQWASVKTHDSIRGYPPGTRLTVVGNFGDHLKVKVGNVEFEVKTNQVTTVRQQQQKSEAQLREIAQAKQTKRQHDTLRDLEARYNALQQQEDSLLLQIGEAEKREKSLPNAAARDKQKQLYDRRDYPNGLLVGQLPLLQSSLREVRNKKNYVKSQLEQAQRSPQKQQEQQPSILDESQP